MSPRAAARTQPCDRSQARVRLAQAHAFLDAAELIADIDDELATPNVTAALAVLAGIAASDAACCVATGRRSRGQDHRQAIELLRGIEPAGTELARDLARLLDIKDGAQYGVMYVSGTRAAAAVRQARRLLTVADNLVRSG